MTILVVVYSVPYETADTLCGVYPDTEEGLAAATANADGKWDREVWRVPVPWDGETPREVVYP